MAARKAICLALVALPAAMSFLVPNAPLRPTARAGALATVARAATTAAKAGAEADRDLTLADVKGSNTDGVWGEIPEDLYFVANYAAALGGDYPPENVDKSYWDQIKPATYAKLAALSKSADPTTISQGQYVMLMEAIVREAIAKDPKLQRPGAPDPELTEQQEFVYNWINSIDNAEFTKFKEEYKLGDLAPAEWWAKIDEIAAQNTAKGLKVPEMTLDLTGDDFLGVAREEFVKSIKQFLKVEAEMYPVFIISKPGSEEGAKMVDLFNKTMDIPTRTYEVYGFDAFKFKVKADYDWGEARLDAIEQLTGTKELPLVYVNGQLIGGPDQVNAKLPEIKKTVAGLRSQIVEMVESRFPKQEEESNYIGMRKVSAAEYKAYEANQAKNGGMDPLEASRQKAKQAAQK